VPENPGRRSSPSIELSFIRFKSTAVRPCPPIVWLAGGPSDYGSDDIEGPYLALVRAFQTVGDVIALDQRGTGLSRPRLDCPDSVVHLPLNRAVGRDEYEDAYRRAATACNAYLKNHGVDLTTYNADQNVEDVDLLRQALGADTISLYGASYGTTLGLACLRRHSDHVHAAILSGVAEVTRSFRDVDVGSAMYFAMDCASGASAGRLAERREEARVSLVGDALDFPFPEICDCWDHKDLGDSFRSEVRSDVPTLFISGTLDGQTPVRNAAEVRGGFPRGIQLVVEGASHTYTELDPEEIRRFMVAFLRGEVSADARMVAPPLHFAPLSATPDGP
jgi:pimeloyl-ACP methyl ester carboxylesterase